MPALSRRAMFALPLVAPLAVPAVVAAASAAPAKGATGFTAGSLTGKYIDVGLPWRGLDSFEIDLSELEPVDWCPFERRLFSPSVPRDRDLAATLGIPYEGPREWTVEEVAATLGIDPNAAARDRLIATGKVAPDATPERAVDAFLAARPVLDGKGGV